MAGTINMYETRSLSNAINKVKVPEPFILNMFFKKNKFHAAETIDIEITNSLAKLAKFVNPDEPALLVKKRTRDVKSFRIPRTFEKKNFTAYELSQYNSLDLIYLDSVNEKNRRADAWVLDELSDLKLRVLRRREQMACEVLTTGAIEYVGDEYLFNADFGFIADTHLVTLSGAALWSADTSTPLADIRGWKRGIARRCGITPDVCVMGTTAAEAFIVHADIKAYLDTNNYKIGQLDLTRYGEGLGNYIGRIHGVDFFEYGQEYIDTDDSTVLDMFDPKKILMGTTAGEFKLHHGAIWRIENQKIKTYQTEYFVSPKTNLEKTYLEWSGEQKSVPVPHDADNVVCATVIG